jgi:uncharacterized membrane protein YcfT
VLHYFYFYALWAVIHILFKVALVERDPLLAATYLARAVVEPYGVLWFIYMLAVVAAASKVLFELGVPRWLVLAGAAALQMAPVHSGIYILDQFADYFVFFYAGYALAPAIFRLVDFAGRHVALSVAGLAVWALATGLLVFTPGHVVAPGHVTMGLAGLPGVHLVLAVAGASALCVLAGLLSRLAFMDWLRWLGGKSIVVYLAFALPMGVVREVLLRLGLVRDAGLLSTVVMVAAIVAPLVLWWLVQKTGWGRFLFERPAWAHIPGAPGSRSARAASAAPAE